jgi:hypothetical protein
MSPEELHDIVRRTLSPGRFLVRAGAVVTCQHDVRQSLSWEILGGHLLDHTQTREVRNFATWDVRLGETADGSSSQPLLSVLYAEDVALLYVVRHLLVHGFEAYAAEPNVIMSRPAQKWTRELVGTIHLNQLDADELAHQLGRLVLMALAGTSRLPVTSWESPLPAFTLGQCGYLPVTGTQESELPAAPAASPLEFLRRAALAGASLWERAKALDAALRAASLNELPQLAELVIDLGGSNLIRTLFNHLALTPYTRIGENFMALLRHLAAIPRFGAEPAIDLVGYVLRHLVRHVTAFDLHTFHNRGSDYPDLLLLDGLLTLYLELLVDHPQQLDAQTTSKPKSRLAKLRRRALRQAWYVRRHYEGLPVPEVPTSPGDHLRVLPEEFPRAAQEEIIDPRKRRKRLFSDSPLDDLLTEPVQGTLAASLADLADDAELRELGTATYLDRPLGAAKPPGEVDRTPLLTYEAFSRTIAKGRLRDWQKSGMLDATRCEELTRRVDEMALPGYSVAAAGFPPRPGVPCLEDANLAAPDFVFLRTTRSSLDEFLSHFNLEPLRERFHETYLWLCRGKDVLLIRTHTGVRPDQPLLTTFDAASTPRLQLALVADHCVSYVESAGRELPVGGLHVIGAANAEGNFQSPAEDLRLVARPGA